MATKITAILEDHLGGGPADVVVTHQYGTCTALAVSSGCSTSGICQRPDRPDNVMICSWGNIVRQPAIDRSTSTTGS